MHSINGTSQRQIPVCILTSLTNKYTCKTQLLTNSWTPQVNQKTHLQLIEQVFVSGILVVLQKLNDHLGHVTLHLHPVHERSEGRWWRHEVVVRIRCCKHANHIATWNTLVIYMHSHKTPRVMDSLCREEGGADVSKIHAGPRGWL